MNNGEVLKNFAKNMETVGCSPKHLQLCKVGPFFLASAFDLDNSEIIAESATCGFAKDRDIAVTKALVEWMERKVARLGYNSGALVCQTETSDGIAAYPSIARESSVLARENALNEAIERFVWATWWDDTSISYRVTSVQDLTLDNRIQKSILELAQQNGIIDLKVIVPSHNDKAKQVIILFGFTKNGGVFSGGACGRHDKMGCIIERAFAELYRHTLAFNRAQNKNLKVNSFYEQRLAYFGSGAGLEKVQTRLSKNGTKIINLPSLKFDEEIKSPYSSFVYAHRCLFEDQPPFVSGEMERLCL